MPKSGVVSKGIGSRIMDKATRSAIEVKARVCASGCPKIPEEDGFVVLLSRNRPECPDQAKVMVRCLLFDKPVKPVQLKSGLDYKACHRLIRFTNGKGKVL